jgi:uncharacterized protein with PIN domain
MAKFYTNENFPWQAVQMLRTLGHDVLTSLEAGKANQSLPDKDVVAFACQQDRILLTLNRKHFVKLHQADSNHSGIIVCSFDVDYAGLAKRISAIVWQNESMAGKLVRVNRPG